MVGYAQHCQTILWFFDLLALRLLSYDFGDQLVLDEDKSFHCVLQGQFVLTHLTEDSADVEVNISGVQDLQAIINALLAKVQIVVLDLESLLQVCQGRPQLLGSTEDASKVVIGNRSVLVSIVGQGLSFSEELEGHVEALYGQVNNRY